MNDYSYSSEVLKEKSACTPITPLPVYPKIKNSEAQNNLSNISTEYSSRDESKISHNTNYVLQLSENENTENKQEFPYVNNYKPITLKKSSFSFCKNSFFNKNFEEQKINVFDVFSSLRIKPKNANFNNNIIPSPLILEKSHSNNPQLKTDKISDDISLYENNSNMIYNKNNYKINNYSPFNFNLNTDNKNLNFHHLGSQLFPIQNNFTTENFTHSSINNLNSNINNSNSKDNHNIKYAEVKLLKHKSINKKRKNSQNNFSNKFYENEISEYSQNKDSSRSSVKSSFIMPRNACNNFEMSSKKNISEVSNSNLKNNEIKISNNNKNNTINNYNFRNLENTTNFNDNQNLNKDQLCNINNIMNIYINFDNGNTKNCMLDTKDNNSNIINIINPENFKITDEKNIIKNRSPAYNPDTNAIVNHEDIYDCINTGNSFSNLLLNKEKKYKKNFNICDLLICDNKINKLTNGFFDNYNIELVEPLYKNNFKCFNFEKKGTKSISSEKEFIDQKSKKSSRFLFLKKFRKESDFGGSTRNKQGKPSEEQLREEIRLKINNFFELLNQIQQKYLTKASGYISKKAVLNCSLLISQINSLIEEIIELNPREYAIDENDLLNFHRLKENNSQEIFEKKIFTESQRCKVFVERDESEAFSSNLDLNDLNQMDLNEKDDSLIKIKSAEKKFKNIYKKDNKVYNNQIQYKNKQKMTSSDSINDNDNKSLISADDKTNQSSSEEKNYLENSEENLKDESVSFTSSQNSSANNITSKQKNKLIHNTKTLSFLVKPNITKRKAKSPLSSCSSAIENSNKEVYKCDHCDAFYYTGQALGGHMSRTHPNLSVKYKLKKMVRDRRENQRNVLNEARKQLLNNYNLDYEDMRNDKIKKHIVKSFIRKHSAEYKEIVKKIKKQKSQISKNKFHSIKSVNIANNNTHEVCKTIHLTHQKEINISNN